MSNDKPENFLGRWSRMKRRAATSRPDADDPSSAASTPQHDGAEAGDATDRTQPSDPKSAAVDTADRMLGDADFADVDFDALDFSSDYTRFMGRNVPDSIRNKALSKLWGSNPLLANLDGLDDYLDDYTDAAVAVAPGTLKTAYKIGQGFLSDEEAAEWDRLGKPEPEPQTAAGGPSEPQAGDQSLALAAASHPEPGDGLAGERPCVVAAMAADAWVAAQSAVS